MMMEKNNNNTVVININDEYDDDIPPSHFAVTFFDGEREVDKGTIPITPSLTFKSFQSILSNKLQISPHQITTYYERRNNFHHNNHHHRRRHPVTNKFDFGSIMSDSNTSFFWVVQKRSRRTRRRKPKVFPTHNNVALLGRNKTEMEYFEYVNRVRMQVERERERYLMSLSLNSNVYDDLNCFFDGGFGGTGGGGGGGGGFYGNFSDDGASSSCGGSSVGGFCDVCYNDAVKGETTPFHCCKNDAVTQIFRSPAGPIAPPKKSGARRDFVLL